MALNYKEYGKGIPLVILHGLLGMLDNWHSFSKKLAEDYWIIAVDQRNHGKSFWSDDFSYPLMSVDLYEMIHELELTDPIVMGHSMGGKTAMQFAHDYPNHIEKLVVVDIIPRPGAKKNDNKSTAV